MRAANSRSRATRTANQRGYAYIIALLMATIMMIAMAAVIPNMLTEGRREKEQDMVWRGKQYDRAIRMYVRKFGKYPTSMDNLIKPQNGVRYMRQAYKDPMNPDEGKWRFIYVTAGGALIGSNRYHSLQELALADQHGGILPVANCGNNSIAGGLGQGFGQGTTAGGFSSGFGQAVASALNNSNPQSGTNSQNGTIAQAGTNGQANANSSTSGGCEATSSTTSTTSGTSTTSTTSQNSAAFGSTATGTTGADSSVGSNLGSAQGMFSSQQPQPLSGDVVGGNIIGVGGVGDKPSVRVYRGGKKYKDWEFIFDPLTQTATIGGQQGTGIPGATTLGQPIGQPAGQQTNPQQNGFGGPAQAPPTGTVNPPTPDPNQPPQQPQQ